MSPIDRKSPKIGVVPKRPDQRIWFNNGSMADCPRTTMAKPPVKNLSPRKYQITKEKRIANRSDSTPAVIESDYPAEGVAGRKERLTIGSGNGVKRERSEAGGKNKANCKGQ